MNGRGVEQGQACPGLLEIGQVLHQHGLLRPPTHKVGLHGTSKSQLFAQTVVGVGGRSKGVLRRSIRDRRMQ